MVDNIKVDKFLILYITAQVYGWLKVNEWFKMIMNFLKNNNHDAVTNKEDHALDNWKIFEMYVNLFLIWKGKFTTNAD